MQSLEEKQTWMNSRKWFHSIDFGNGLKSPSRFKNRPPNFSLYGVQHFLEQIDVNGHTCLDIGTVDGLTAFMLKSQGAKRVIASDIVRRPTFEFGRDHLELDIDYRVPAKIDTLADILEGEKLDLIVNAGILYHLIDPIGGLLETRKLLKPGGLMIMETIHLVEQGKNAMYFSPSSNTIWKNDLENFYWIPSLGAIEGMMELASFEVLGYACSNERVSVLAKAIKPSETRSSGQMVSGLLKKGKQQKGYDEDLFLSHFEADTTPVSSIQHRVERYGTWIRPTEHKTMLPFQPDCSHLDSKALWKNRAIDLGMYLAYCKGRAEASLREALFG